MTLLESPRKAWAAQSGIQAAHADEKGLDRFLEFLGGAEGDLLARLDLDRLAGGGIAAHASGSLADLKDAESADAEAVAFLQVLHHQADEVAENRFGLLLCHFMGLGKGGGDMLQGNGLLCCGCFCHRKLLLYERITPISGSIRADT